MKIYITILFLFVLFGAKAQIEMDFPMSEKEAEEYRLPDELINQLSGKASAYNYEVFVRIFQISDERLIEKVFTISEEEIKISFYIKEGSVFMIHIPIASDTMLNLLYPNALEDMRKRSSDVYFRPYKNNVFVGVSTIIKGGFKYLLYFQDTGKAQSTVEKKEEEQIATQVKTRVPENNIPHSSKGIFDNDEISVINPVTSDEITIIGLSKEVGLVPVVLTTLEGNVVISQSISRSQNSIDVSQLDAGVYLLKELISGSSKRIIIQ